MCALGAIINYFPVICIKIFKQERQSEYFLNLRLTDYVGTSRATLLLNVIVALQFEIKMTSLLQNILLI